MSNTAKKVEGVSAVEAKQLGIDAANRQYKHDGDLVAGLLSDAKVLPASHVPQYINALGERFEQLGYTTVGSMKSRYKGAILLLIKTAGQYDYDGWTITELYQESKRKGTTQNKRGAGNKTKTKAQKLHDSLDRLVKQYGKDKVAAMLKKL